MNRFPPRFMQPMMPNAAGPIGNVQFRPPQGNNLRLGGGGGSSETTGPGRPQQQQGGGGMGGAMGLGGLGLLSKIGGPQASSVLDPGFASQAAQWPGIGAAGAWPEMAMTAGGGGGGLLGSLGGVAGGMTGADLGPMADLGIQAAGENALALSNPATAALAAPGLLNMAGINMPNPMSWISKLFGG